MSKRLDRKCKYQVWITSYALDGTSEASKYDPGQQLIGMHDDISAAVMQARENESYDPIITKLVVIRESIVDVTDMKPSDPGATEGLSKSPQGAPHD